MSEDRPTKRIRSSPEKPSSSPKGARPSEVWAVVVTHYTDDYKPRGDSWSSGGGVFLFWNEEDAEKDVIARKRDFLEDEEEIPWDEIGNGEKEPQEWNQDAILEKMTDEDIEALFEKMSKGYYVPVKVTFVVEKRSIC